MSESPEIHKPWMGKKAWASNRIRSSSKGMLLITWGFAIVWNAIVFPVLVPEYDEHLAAATKDPLMAVFLFFPVLGLVVIGIAIKQTLTYRRFGNTLLVLDPFPGSIGGQIGGSLDLNMPFDTELKVNVVLSCIRSYLSGTGKNRSRQEDVKWQNESYCHIEPGPKGIKLKFRFDVPQGLPESDAKRGQSYHYWQVRFKASIDGPDFDAAFDIPVYPTGAHSEFIHRASEEHQQNLADAMGGLDAISTISESPTGIDVIFPYLTQSKHHWLTILFGATFAVIGNITGALGAPVLFPIVFSLFGLLIVCVGIFGLLNSLHIRIRDGLLIHERKFLGRIVKRIQIEKSAIKDLEIKSKQIMTNGKERTVSYQLLAISKTEQRVVVGERFDKRSEAEQLKDKYHRYLDNSD